MSDEEKIAAFDDLAEALTNRWVDGKWTWYCLTPAGGSATPRATQEEALADLVAWAKRTAKKQRNKRCSSSSIPLTTLTTPPENSEQKSGNC